MSISLRRDKGSPLTHDELDDNFSALTGSLTAGAGLTGGGLKEDELTFDVGQGDGIQVNPDSVQVDSTVARRNNANIFTGNQTITGSLYVTGSSEFIGNSKFVGDQTITGSLFTSGSSEFIGTSLFQGDQTITGSLSVSGSTDFQGASIFEGNQTITGSLFVSGTFEHTGIINLKPTSPPASSTSPQAYIYSSGLEGDLYFRQTSPRGLNETRLRWLEGNVYTGILSGGVVSGSVGGTTFNVSEGSGLIVTLNASTGSEELYPIFNYVEWNDFTNVSADYLATENTTWLLIDENGDLVQQATAPTNGQFADNITLGAVIHPNNTTISFFKTFPVTSYGLAQQTYEFIRVFGPIKKSGHTISAGTTSLTVDRASGVSFALGRNYINDPDDPSIIEDPAQSEATIFRYYASGSEFVTVPNQATIDPANYNTPDTATGLTAVPAGQYSIQRVFFFPDQSDILAVYYGRDTYNSISTALDNLNFEPFQEIENTIQQAIFLGYIIVKANATDLSVEADARFIQAGNFRSTATSGGGGGAEVVTTLGDLSDVTFGTLVDGDLLVYNGAEWQNRQNNLSVSGSFSGSFQGSDIDVTSGSFDRIDVSGNGQVDGNLTVGGIITAQEFHTEFVSASIIYESGSTKFGDTLDDTHDFTGSVNISGSFEVTGSGTISGDLVVGGTVTAQEFHTEFVSASILFQSGSTKFGDTQDDVHAFTGSVSITGSSLSMTGNITGSSNLDIAGTVDANVYSINDIVVVDSSRNITGSNSIFSGYISGSSLDVTGNIDGNDVSINDIIVIDSSRNITGSNAHFSGYISGSSLDVTGNIDGNDISINDTIVIDSSRNITGSNAHFSGYVSGSSLDVTGNIDGDTVSINDTIVIDSSRNITGSNAHFSGYVSASSLDVTGRADANEYSINDTIVIDSDRNVTGSNADFSGTVDANEYSINDTIVIDSDRNFTGSNADFSGNVDVAGNITVLGNANLGDSTTNDLHIIKGITQVTGSFSTDDIKLDGSVISTFTGNLEVNPAKIVDLKSSVTASANDFKIQHTGANNFTLTSDNGNVLVENSTFSGDDVTIPGDLAVNGGDITTTTSGTGNIFNANATTLNIGGAATAIELGATTGTTSINNDLTVDGNATFGNAEADRIDIRGQIIALSGSNTVIEQRSTGVGSLRIQSIGSTNNKLILSASGDIEVKQSVTMTDLGTSIQSSGYQSGFAGQGFDINYGPKSSAEFDNLTVRGSMRVFELLINQVRATNGSLFVSSTGKVDSVVDLGTTDGQGRREFALIFDTGSGTVGHGFTDGDVIRAQQVDRNAIANAGDTQNVNGSLVFRSDLTVTDVQDLKIVTASLSQSSTPPTASYEYVRLGSTSNENRRGNVYLTADDNYAPFIDVVDGITSHDDWNNSATDGGVKVRVGKIDGINSPVFNDLSGYGMWASGSVYLEGSINATAGLIGGWAISPGYLQSNNIKLQSSGSEGGELISIGETAGMSGDGIFLSGSGDFNLQTNSNNFIRKSGNLLDIKSEEFSLSTGNLTISGSSTDGFISLGTLEDASTVSNTNDGFFVSASGDVLIKGGAIADNRYIKVNSSGLEIKTDVFDLDAGQLELFGNTDSAYLKMGTLANAKDTNNSNYGVYIDHSGSLLLKSTDVDKNYIRVSGSGFIDINADKFKLQAGSPVSLVLTEADGGFLALGGSNYTDAQIALSGSGEAKFGNINVDGTDGGSIFSGTTALSTTASPGLFLSGSGEFNLVYDTDNFIRRVGTKLSIGATTASINTPTLDLNTAAGGTIALGDTEGINPPNLSNPGIFLSGSGEFNFEVDDNNRITRTGSLLEIRSTDFIIETSTFDVSTEDGGFFRLGPGIVVGEDTLFPSMTTQGIFMSGSGEFNFEQDDDNRLTFDDGVFEIRATTASLSGSNIEITTTNLEIDTSTFTLNTDAGGTIALGDTDSLYPPNLNNPGIFLSGSGEFNFQQDSNNRITFDNESLEIRATTASLSGSNIDIITTNLEIDTSTFALNTDAGGTIALGDSPPTNLSSNGIFLSGSGEFNFQSGSNNRLTFSGSLFELRTTDAIISGSSVQIETPSFFLGGENQYISGSNGNIEISGSNFHLLNGNLTASNVDLSGKITATSGEIGGFTISEHALAGSSFYISGSATNNEFFISSSNFNVKANGDVTGSQVLFTGGKISGSSISFDVTDFKAKGDTVEISGSNFHLLNGNITASNVDLSGKITATSGNIGGFAITDSAITGSGFLISGSATGNEFFISASNFNVKANGDLTASNADISGKITAQSGTIGGFTITQDALEGSNFYISGSATNEEFFISASKFNVKASGDITGSSVLFTGGRIGGFNITGSTLTGNDGAIVLDADNSAIELDDGSNILDLKTGTLTTTSGTVQPSWSTPSNILNNVNYNSITSTSGEATIGNFQLTATGVHTDSVTLDQTTTTINPSGIPDGVVTVITGIRIRRGNETTGTIVFDSGLPGVSWNTGDGTISSTATKSADIVIDNTGTNTYYIKQYYSLEILPSPGNPGSWGITARTNISGNSLDLALPFDIVELTTSGIQVMSANNRYFRVRKIGSPLVDIAGELAVTGPITGSTLQTTGDTIIKGNLIVEGDTDISVGSVTGHPNITPGSNISINNSNGFVIQDLTLTLDSNGHVTTSTAASVDLDQRYIQIGGISGFVETTGDEMTGKLTISSGGLEVTGSTDIKGQVSVNSGTSDKVLDLRSTDNYATIYLSDDATGSGNKGEAIRRLGDTLSLHSNGTKTLIISGSNVGINDDTPEETLTVAGTAKVTGLVTGKAFRTISSNTDFSLITRNEAAASHSLHIQNGVNSSDSKIARFAYGSLAANSGTTVLQIAGDQSYFDNTKLGIGTDNPVSLLHLEDGSSPTLRIKDTTNNVTLLAYAQDTNAHIGTYSNHDLVFDTNSTPRMTIDNDGDVNITNNLTVGGIVTAQEFHTEFVSASIVFQSGSTKFGDTSDDIHSFSGSLRVTGSGDHYITNGNVGIGTSTSIQEKLHLNGGTDDVALRIDTTDADPKIRLTTLTQQDWSLGIDYSDAGKFKIAESGFPGTNDALVIDVNRKVGIGTSDPVKNFEVEVNNTDTTVTTGNGFAGGVAGNGILIRNSSTTSGTYANLDFRANNADGRIAYQYKGTTNVGDFHFITDNLNSPKSSMIIKNDGKVGIGTDPTAVLHMSAASPTFYMDDTSTTGTRTRFQLVTGDIGSTQSALFSFNNTSATSLLDVMTLNETGNVGIGTTSPSDTLTYGRALDIQSSTGAAVYLRDSDDTSKYGLFSYDGGAVNRTNIGGLGTDNYLRILSAGSEAMRIDSSGNVGINYSNGVIHTFGSGVYGGRAVIKASSDNALALLNSSTGGSAQVALNFTNEFVANQYNYLARIVAKPTQAWTSDAATRDSDLIFFTTLNGVTAERMRIDASGNVGIGETTPASLLHLSGSSNNAIVTLENNGNGNVSGIDFVRERSTGPGVNGGSLFLESNTANNNSTIYLQAQTAGADAGTTSALTANNGVRLVLKGGQGIFSVETGTSEAFKVDNGETVITGDLTVSGTLTATSIIETSTRELKDNIITLGSQEEIVDKLQPVSYTWKEDGVEDFGLIAEDVEEIAPHLVSRDDNGNPTGIKYSKLSVLLLDVVKKQSTLIEDLNKRITKLEDKT